MGIASVLSPFAIVRQLRLGAGSSTFDRLGRSRHVADLRLIFSFSLIIMIVSTILALAFCFAHEVMTHKDDVHGWMWMQLAFEAVFDGGVFIVAVGLVGCGVFAWTYQVGSARLGLVDLFASEIATLCRVAAVVDMVRRYTDLFQFGPQAGRPHRPDGELLTDADHFSSKESYFPVFVSSVMELQALEADVIKHVTAFYTYLKAMNDLRRRLADITPPDPNGPHDNDWHGAICNVIYMQFLALESGRRAIKDLVEFEPTQAEVMITILLSELLAYGFLREQFRGDLRQRRLEARDEAYRREVPAIHRLVMVGTGQQWDAAKDLSAEMMKRFDRVLVDTAFDIEAPSPFDTGRRRTQELSGNAA